MPKAKPTAPPSQYKRKVGIGHLPMMKRMLDRISQNDLHWLTSMETQELKALLDLIQTAKLKRLDIATLLEEHNRHCTGPERN